MRLEPLQNRVSPKGKICAVTQRGTYMGNRGILHDDEKEVFRQFRLKNWIICKLDFKNRQREVMAPKRYTELFFLDEATAFSAGHRPCAECRRERFKEFKQAWTKANEHLYNLKTNSIKEIDELLHDERIDKKRKKVTYFEEFKNLPNGTFIQINLRAYLIWNTELFTWSFEGYKKTTRENNPVEKIKYVEVLTPKSIVNMFKRGFVPKTHFSLEKLLDKQTS